MFCTNCGTKLPDEAVFCSQCGTRLNYRPAAPAQEPAYAPYSSAEETPDRDPVYMPYAPMEGFDPCAMPASPKKSKRPLLIGLIAAVVVVGVLLFALWGFGGGNGSAEAVAEQFYAAVLKGDVKGAKECVHPDMWQEIGGEFEQDADMMAMLGDTVKVTVIGSENVTLDERDDVKEILRWYGIDERVGKIYEVEISVQMSFWGMEESRNQEITVAQIGGTYYIVDVE